MKELKLNFFARDDFLDDVDKLQQQLREAGFKARKEDISFAWERYSDSLYAQCLSLDNLAENNVKHILEYFSEVEDE